jgi:hypothetical protein
MQHRNVPRGYFESAAHGCAIGILGLLLISIASGFLGALMAGWGCFVIPFLVLVGGGVGSLGGIAYRWYQTE